MRKSGVASCLLIVLIVAPVLGCKSLSVSTDTIAGRYLEKIEPVNKTITVGIKNVASDDIYLKRLFNNYLSYMEKRKDIRIVKDYGTLNKGNVDYIAEFDCEIEYNYNTLRSIFIAFPGNFIFMPSWNGMSYSFLVKGMINIYDSRNSKINEDYYFRDKYVVNQSTPARILTCYTVGLIPPYSFLAGAFSFWDDEMKNDTVEYMKKTNYFNQVMTSRLFEAIRAD